jgi:hypothetical protein
MNKQQLIERIEGLKNLFGNKTEYIETDAAIELISKLDEPQKPVIPQFVADWIERRRKIGEYSLLDAMHLTAQSEDFRKWIMSSKHQNIFARAWLDGYVVEKEKRHLVKLKNTNDYLNQTEIGFHFYDNGRNNEKFTRKEIEDAGFGWVFDCPGIEIEEAE